MLVTSPESAEMIKYASNAYLATRVSFTNAIANLCEDVGADVKDVTLGMGHDLRIGPAFLHPARGTAARAYPRTSRHSCGVAGGAGYDFDLLRCAVDVNRRQRDQATRS